MDSLLTRSSSHKLHVSTGSNDANGTAANGEVGGRGINSKRPGDMPLSAKRVTTGSGEGPPTTFSLGSNAFAFFGSNPNGPNPFESIESFGNVGAKTPTLERDDAKSGPVRWSSSKPGSASGSMASPVVMTPTSERPAAIDAGYGETGGERALKPGPHPLRDTWCFWIRPPLPKSNGYINYAKTLHPMAAVSTVEEFWDVYTSIVRPSDLKSVYSQVARPATMQTVIDLHLFKKGIRPIWEDEENRNGGKWIVRLPKNISDRLWEDLLLALIGDCFDEANEDICGAVLSVREPEDTLSIWTRNDRGRVLEAMKRELKLLVNARVEFKSHDSSIQQRMAIEESRREKATNHHHHHHHHHQVDKRRGEVHKGFGEAEWEKKPVARTMFENVYEDLTKNPQKYDLGGRDALKLTDNVGAFDGFKAADGTTETPQRV